MPETRHDIVAYLFEGRDVTALQSRGRPPAGKRARQAAALPLIVRTPQWVRFADRCFCLRREGLYRFWDWGKAEWDHPDAYPVIIDARKQYTSVILYRSDIMTLLGSLATIQVHGLEANGLSHKDRLAAAKRGLLSLNCGGMSPFCCRVLKALGWKARVVQSVRIEGAYNTYDSGHVLFEFYWPKYRKWVLADVDAGNVFRKGDNYLNLGELSGLIAAQSDFEVVPLTSSTGMRMDSTMAVAGAFPAYEQFQHNFSDPCYVKTWYRRMLRAPLIHDGAALYGYAQPGSERLNEIPWDIQILERPDWLARFYGART